MDLDVLKMQGLSFFEITERISLVQGDGRGRNPYCSALLIRDEVTALIDSGLGHGPLRALLAAVHIDVLFNSHSHPDHIGGNWIAAEQGCRIVVPEQSFATIGSAERLALRFMGPERAAEWIEQYVPLTGYRDFQPDASFCDGQVLDFGRTRLTAIHAPGHLSDHYCFYEPNLSLLVSSDIDLSPYGPWYGNRESDLNLFRESLALVTDLEPAVIAPSHARPVRGLHVAKRLNAYAAALDERERLIASLLPDEPFTAEQLARLTPISGPLALSDSLIFEWETEMVRKHLDEMVRAGGLACTGPLYSLN
ncbi:MAG: Hydroxyacylglutathione hydrolase [Deltaproteobacteria bacterium ADurb.Bin510]|nr:MAG: Hydroxyacylglutathione hydrolase [Deltaproteobacteria bacterium ADurb.Bin510]